MSVIFAIDADKTFQDALTAVCNERGDAEIQFYESSMAAISRLKEERPSLMFANLELPDMNDFVMYDLLKKANMEPVVPVIITYEEKTVPVLPRYQKLKFQNEGFFKKPITRESIHAFLVKYLGEMALPQEPEPEEITNDKDDQFSISSTFAPPVMSEEEDVIFTEVTPGAGLELQLTSEYKARQAAEKPKQGVFKVSDGASPTANETEKQIAERIISLEKQDRFLRQDNERLQAELTELQKKLAEQPSENILFDDGKVRELEGQLNEACQVRDDLAQKFSTLETDNQSLTDQVKSLTERLTDKERELVAQNHEFEKNLLSQTEDLLQKTELRLKTEFKEKEEKLLINVGRLENEKNRIETDLNDKLEKRNAYVIELSHEIEELKNVQKSLNNAIININEEKNTLEQKINLLQKENEELIRDKEGITQQLKSSESDLTTAKNSKDTLEQELQTTKDSITHLEKEKEGLAQILTAAEESFSRLEDEKKTLSQKILSAEQTIAELEKEKENVTVDLASADEKIYHLENEKEAFFQKFTAAEVQITALENDKETQSNKLTGMASQLANTQKSLEKQIKESSEKESQLMNTIEKITQERESVSAKLTFYINQMEALSALLQQANELTQTRAE